jgi:adenylate kinase
MGSLVIFSKLMLCMEEKENLVEHANQLLSLKLLRSDQAFIAPNAKLNF